MSFLKLLYEEKIIAIVRGIPEDRADAAASALHAGGIRFIEVTMNTPGAADMIRRWRRLFEGKMIVGAGTVLDLDSAKAAVEAGAEYIVTPNTDEAVIRYAAANCAGVVPGAMTPTEIVHAWKLGASAIKVFPAGSLGANYFKELQGPLSHIPMIATGGVNLNNMGEYVKAGAKALGLGSNLVNKEWIQAGEFDRLKENAAQYVAAAKRPI